jgi:hypothetical protein
MLLEKSARIQFKMQDHAQHYEVTRMIDKNNFRINKYSTFLTTLYFSILSTNFNNVDGPRSVKLIRFKGKFVLVVESKNSSLHRNAMHQCIYFVIEKDKIVLDSFWKNLIYQIKTRVRKWLNSRLI